MEAPLQSLRSRDLRDVLAQFHVAFIYRSIASRELGRTNPIRRAPAFANPTSAHLQTSTWRL